MLNSRLLKIFASARAGWKPKIKKPRHRVVTHRGLGKEYKRLAATGAIIKPVDDRTLSSRVRDMVSGSGRSWISRNSKCVCGSQKRFKRCCQFRT